MKTHVYPRGADRWVVVVELGKHPETGKRKQKWVTVRGTKREAHAKATELAHKVETGQYMEPSKITLADWLEQWLAQYVSVDVSPASARSYREAAAFWIKRLGPTPLAALTPLKVQQVLSTEVKAFSAATLRHRLLVLRKAMRQAVGADLIYRDPTQGARPPRQDHRAVQTADVETLQKIAAAAEGTRWHLPILLAINTGMRRGEVLGLRWRDVNPDGSYCQVESSYGNEGGLGPVKTSGSLRQVPLPLRTVQALRAERKVQAELKLYLGKGYHDQDLVCCNERGDFLKPNSLSRAFRGFADAAGTTIPFHGLRHSHVTLLLAAGINAKVVQERVGHSDPGFTLAKYASVIPTMQREAIEKWEEVMG